MSIDKEVRRMDARKQPCEMAYRINDGPQRACQAPGHPVMTWNEESGQVEQEWLCREHERMLYGCQGCGDVKASWRVPLCERCLQEQRAHERGGEGIE